MCKKKKRELKDKNGNKSLNIRHLKIMTILLERRYFRAPIKFIKI